MAGQFKTLNTAGLAEGQQQTAVSSPKNSGLAMEMEVYEWTSRSAGGYYQCRILSNFTGEPLTITFMGVNGTIIDSCTAPAGGTCDVPAYNLFGNLKFQCLVATGYGSPVISTNTYKMAVRRVAPVVLGVGDGTPSPAGVITQ
jgi:hypothetical protein